MRKGLSRKTGQLIALLVLALYESGCATAQTTDQLSAAAANFDKSVQSANGALETELKAKPRTRRFEAIEYYLVTRRLVGTEGAAVVQDLTESDQLGSFARYACAGSGSLVTEKKALESASTYSSGLKDILAPGANTLSGQFARLKALNKPVTVPSAPDVPANKHLVQDCATSLAATVSAWRPSPTTDPYDENPVLIITAAEAFYQAVNKFLTTGLADWNNYAEKKKFTEYVNKWDPSLRKVLTTDLDEAKLANAWSHREAVSVQRSLILFKQIFITPKGLSPSDDDDRIRTLGMEANDQLAEFDALHAAPKPVDIRKALLAAQDQIVKLANDKTTSPAQVASFLSALVDEFNSAKSQYDDADKAGRALVTTLRK